MRSSRTLFLWLCLGFWLHSRQVFYYSSLDYPYVFYGAVVLVALHSLNLVYHVQSLNNLSEYRVSAVEMRRSAYRSVLLNHFGRHLDAVVEDGVEAMLLSGYCLFALLLAVDDVELRTA